MTKLFVYGTLRPGQVLWSLIEPAVQSSPVCILLRGYGLVDSGHHYPYMVPTHNEGDVVRGSLLDIDLDTKAARQVFNMEFGAGYQLITVETDAGYGCAFIWPHIWAELMPHRTIGGLRIHDFAIYRESLGYSPDKNALLEK